MPVVPVVVWARVNDVCPARRTRARPAGATAHRKSLRCITVPLLKPKAVFEGSSRLNRGQQTCRWKIGPLLLVPAVAAAKKRWPSRVITASHHGILPVSPDVVIGWLVRNA